MYLYSNVGPPTASYPGRELHQVTVTFDPYVTMPEFLDDGALETRLRRTAEGRGILRL